MIFFTPCTQSNHGPNLTNEEEPIYENDVTEEEPQGIEERRAEDVLDY